MKQLMLVPLLASSCLFFTGQCAASINGVDGADWTLTNSDLPSDLALNTGIDGSGLGIEVRDNRDLYQTFKISAAETNGFSSLAVDSFWLGYDSTSDADQPGNDQTFTLRLFEIPNALLSGGNPPTGGVEIWNSGPTSTQTLGNGILAGTAFFDRVLMIDVSTRQIVLDAGKDYALQIDDDNQSVQLVIKYSGSDYANGQSFSGGSPELNSRDWKFGIAGTSFDRPTNVVPELASGATWIALVSLGLIVRRRQD